MTEHDNKSFRLSVDHHDFLKDHELVLRLDYGMQKVFLFVGLLTMTACSVIYLLIGGKPLILWANAVGVIVLLASYLVRKITKLPNMLLTATLPFFLLIYLPVIWYGSPGILGDIPMVALFLLMLLALIDKSKFRLSLAIIYSVLLTGLVIFDFYRFDVLGSSQVYDYIVHSTLFIALSPALWIIITTYRTRISDHHTNIYQQSITDGLTGCYNKRYGEDQLKRMHSYYLRNNYPYSVILFDIDHFKMYNDKYGHHVGDEVLLKLCDCIQNTTRQNDMLIRYGGDEFILLLPGATLSQAKALATLLQSRARKLEFEQIRDHITVSIGVIDADRARDKDMDIIKQADLLMYQAKWRGRDCIISADIWDDDEAS